MITQPLPRVRTPHEPLRASGGGARFVVGAVVAAIALAGAFALTYSFFVRTASGQALDEHALVGGLLQLRTHPLVQEASTQLNDIPQDVGILGAIGVLVAAAVGRRWRTPLIGVAAGGVAMIATQVLKHLLLTRPDLGLSMATGNSFPSGHTTAAASALMALIIAAPPAARGILGIVAAVGSAVAGSTTIVMGWHRPSDVIGALLLVGFFGVIAGVIAHGVDSRRGRVARRNGPRGGAALPVAAMVVGGLILVVATIVADPLAAGADGSVTVLDATTLDGATHDMLCGVAAVVGTALISLPLVSLIAGPRRR